MKPTAMEMTVENNKPVVQATHQKGGIGLANLRKRLELLYPGSYTLQTEDKPDTYKAALYISFVETSSYAELTILNYVVIDDEPLAREVLDGYLGRLDFVESVHQFGNAREALVYLENNSTDVLFLDIEMPGMNGIDFLKLLPHPPITVFTTAYRDYAFDGFELGVTDFLLKPIAFPRFLQTVEKIRDFLSLKDYAIIYTTTGKIVIKGSIKSMHAIFPESRFMRVHKSFIVAMARVTRIERNRLLLKEAQVPIGRSYKRLRKR